MEFLISCSIIFILSLIIYKFFTSNKTRIPTWENKPFDEELTHEEKRQLIFQNNKPRSRTTGYGWERNTTDLHFFMILDRFCLSYQLGNIRPGETTNIGGEMASATPEVINQSSKGYKVLYERIKTEYKIDLFKLASRDKDGADLSTSLLDDPN